MQTKPREIISQSKLKENLEYSHDSGHLIWKTRVATGNYHQMWNALHAGKIAGSRDKDGYRQLNILSHVYRAHSLVWLYVTGEFPMTEIDHINGIKDDNRFGNLRLATRALNTQNWSRKGRGTSGALGVTWNKAAGKWQASGLFNGKLRYLGLYDELTIAAEVAHKWRVENYPGYTGRP